MRSLRFLILRRPALFAALLLAALLVRGLVPTGYMPGALRGGVALRLCPEAAPMPAMHGAREAAHGHAGDHAPATPTCGFAALGPSMPGVEATPTLAIVAATAVPSPTARPRPSTASAHPRLRPPLRAPPLLA